MIQPPNLILAALARKRAAQDKSTFQLMLNMAGVDEALRLLCATWDRRR